MNKTALVIFAREPKDGKVKTRLCGDMPSAVVTRLYKAFMRDVIAIARKAKCDQRFLYYSSSDPSIPFVWSFRDRFQLRRQAGSVLGDRMHQAFVDCSKNGFGKIVIVGTDCLMLTADDIKMAFHELDKCDCVLGPTKDGGYYLIGLNSPDAGLFRRIQWGTSSVLQQTVDRITGMKKTFSLLDQKEDIDTPEDLKRLSRAIKGTNMAVHTQKVLETI